MIDPFCPAPNIDFDSWAKLASQDPQEFEAQRRKIVDQLINQAPEDRRQRLRCLQWRIDQVRDLSHTPMAACLKISRMMWDSVLGPRGLLEVLQKMGQDKNYPLPKGRILPFSREAEKFKAGF